MTLMLLLLEFIDTSSITGKACFRRIVGMQPSGPVAYNETKISRTFSRLSKSTVLACYRRLRYSFYYWFTETITTPRQRLLQLLIVLPTAQLRY